MNSRRKNNKRLMLLVILLAVSIGFALLSTTLKINGTAGVKGNTWDIHWENVVPNQQSTVTTETPVIGDSGTSVTYDVELALPGDFYEFTVDAVNDGSINAKIEDIRHTVKQVTIVNEEEVEETATLPNYILYSVVYDGTNTAPAEGDLLGAHSSKTYKVRIEYDPLATTVPENDLVYRITDEFDYEQTKEVDIQGLLANIEADPDSYRNPEQSVANKDIGIDENGNVINLDMWVTYYNEKVYSKADDKNEIILGKDECNISSCLTPATSAAQVVNGEVQTPIPAYILLSGKDEFYPVTKIQFLFGYCYDYIEAGIPKITVMPDLPNTITEIGKATFLYSAIETVEIPNYIKTIGDTAFCYGSLNSLSFESNSTLERIDERAFESNFISGNLVLPQTVTYIGKSAFRGNSITSVTFSSSATVDSKAFDSGVVISHQY